MPEPQRDPYCAECDQYISGWDLGHCPDCGEELIFPDGVAPKISPTPSMRDYDLGQLQFSDFQVLRSHMRDLSSQLANAANLMDLAHKDLKTLNDTALLIHLDTAWGRIHDAGDLCVKIDQLLLHKGHERSIKANTTR
jgi:hypothetical protein